MVEIKLVPLSRLTVAQVEALRRLRNSEPVRRYMFTRHEIDATEHRQWWGRVIADPDFVAYAVMHREEVLGFISARLLAPGQCASLGIYLKPYEGKGLGQAVHRRFNRFLFDVVGVNRLVAEVQPFNEASKSLYKRLGFTLSMSVAGTAQPGTEAVERFELTADRWALQAFDAPSNRRFNIVFEGDNNRAYRE